jgi:hypothetical protein
LPRCRVVIGVACIATLAAAVAGCSGTSELFDSKSENGLFSKPLNVFSREDGSKASVGTTVSLGPSGPVAPEDLVGPDGRCAPASAPQTAQPEPAPAAPPADRRVGSMAGDLAGAPMPPAPPQGLEPAGLDAASPQVVGGIALGMTECQAVRRAGLASNVAIGIDDKNQRKVVLTYLGGTWPGIYTFVSGRLKEIDRAPEPPKPVKAKPKSRAKKTVKKSTTAR